ncbi:unnamed protein product [Cuscuta epithymum]|nr:unnamed protein product [Cuscuta epithymum]CAH9127638.1 unnamed protein product [Cuscuta epithymum]
MLFEYLNYHICFQSMTKLQKIAITSFLLVCVSTGFLFSTVSCSPIPLGSRLTIDENNYWMSANGNFRFGFSNHSLQFSVGIEFCLSFISGIEPTLVWNLGGHNKVGKKSYVELSLDGELILFDTEIRGIAWKSNTRNAGIESALLRNDGNFVLLNQKKNVIWQSFTSPSDTLLPGQNLTFHQLLLGASEGQEASHYSLSMSASGILQLNWDNSVTYWTAGDPSKSTVHVMLNTEGAVQGYDHMSKVVWSVFPQDFNDKDVKFRFLKLDIDGNLRLYSWRNESRSWRPVWQAVQNNCHIFATCGYDGICIFNSSDSQTCDCLHTSAGEEYCILLNQQNCALGFSMIRRDHTFIYETRPLSRMMVKTSLQHCKRLCVEDPLCQAVSFLKNGTSECQIMKSQFISGWSDPSSSYVSFVKTCLDPIAVLPIQMHNFTNNQSHKVSVLSIIGGITAVSVLACIVFLSAIGTYMGRRIRRKCAGRKEALSSNAVVNSSGCLMLSYSKIKEMTEKFKNQIGPNMFKGVTQPNNKLVVVKDLSTSSIGEKIFCDVVLRLGNVHHKNLLKLEAFCCESHYRILVYEFVRNGSLAECLRDSEIVKRLTWRKRWNICISIARAISYLHNGCWEFISHGNLNCTNVVLDDNLEAKVSGFGLSPLLPSPSRSEESPAEKDIRDFGMMICVLITGIQSGDKACKWAYAKWAAAELETLFDKIIEGVDFEEMERALRLAFWCLQVNTQRRPSMAEIVKVLEGAFDVDPPPPLFG